MFLTSLLLASTPLAPLPGAISSTLQDRRAEVQASYAALHEARDEEGLAKLWSENMGLVLQTIDADLEGGLALWEAAPEDPPRERITALHARALFGARVAAEALDRPLLHDYAISFTGWTDAQKGAFRAGQAVYARGLEELENENLEVALLAGRETVERALPLGDWWGTAMGYSLAGSAHQATGSFEDALASYSMARTLHHGLGLEHSEYEALQGMLNVLRALERHPRARVVANDIIEYARGFQDSATLKRTLSARAQIESALGMTEEESATRAELAAIE